MSEISAWDLDGTIRPGSLLNDAIAHGIAAGFIDAARIGDPTRPTRADINHFVASVTHQPRRIFRELTTKLSDEARDQAYPWALERITAHSAEQHVIILSQSPDFLVEAFARGLGVIRHARGSHYHVHRLRRRFSGQAATLDKALAAEAYMRRQRLQCLGFAAGDTMADLPILQRAEHAAVVNPGRELAELAQTHQWEIITTEQEQ